MKTDPWYVKYFQQHRPFFGEIPEKITRTHVRYLIKKLGLKPGMSFFDCPCGVGRISIPLAKAGIKVTGIDLAKNYLDELEREALRLKLPIKTQQTDMRKVNFANQFDTAGNLWTSFGYLESDADHQLVLTKICRALKPGGRFCLHVMNRDWIIAHFTTESWMETEGFVHTQERKLDLATSTLHGTWTFYKGMQKHKYTTAIRLFSYHELIAMFHKAGFVKVEGFGSTNDDPITKDTMMSWVFGVKPK